MAKTWSQVESSESFTALSPQEKFKAKKQYWDEVVGQKQEYKILPSTSQSEAKKEFFGGSLAEDMPSDYFKVPNIALITIGDTLGTIGKSAGGVLSGAVQPILHPINTVKSIGLVARGAVEKLIPGAQINEQYVDAIGKFYKDRYGSVDGLADTVSKDPIGFLTDVAGISGVGSATLKSVGKATQIKSIAEAGSLAKTAEGAMVIASAVKEKLPKIDFTTETKIFNDFNSVFPSTKKTIGDLKTAKLDVVRAVKAIEENFPEEGIVHPLTGETFIKRPTNRYETLLALDSAKKKIWEKATLLSGDATEKGALIDLKSIAESSAKDSVVTFGKIAAKTTKKQVASEIIKEAQLISRQGKISPRQAEEFMKTLYEDSQKLMQSGDFAQYSKKDFYKNLYGKLREATDTAIESSLDKAGYKHYRSQYASVRKAEDAIKSGANKWLKHNQQGAVGSLADFWSIEELLSGQVGKALTVQGTKQVLKYFKDPDRKVASIFKNASKLKSVEPTMVLKPEVLNTLLGNK